MKKIISFMLVLCMVLGMSVSVFADGETESPLPTPDNNGVITLSQDVTLNSTYDVDGDLTIDLAGYTISGTDTANEYSSLIHVKNGATLTIKDSSNDGNGKITYNAGNGGKTGAAVFVEGTLIQKSGTIEITGGWSFGFAVDAHPNAWGTTYTEPTIFTMKGGKINASDSGVRVANYSSTGAGISATFNMEGGEITSAYDGIFVQHVEACPLNVNISGGTITSETHALRIYGDVINDVNVKITGGALTGDLTNMGNTGNGSVAISGGTFTADVKEFLESGLIQDETGKVVSSTPAPTPTPDDTDDSWYEEEEEVVNNHTSSSDMADLINETGKNDTSVTIDEVNKDTTISKSAMEKAADEGLDIEFEGEGYTLTLPADSADFSNFKGTFNPYIDVDANATTTMKSELKVNGIDPADVQVIKTEYSGELPGEMELTFTLDKDLRSGDVYFYYWNAELKQYELIPHTVKGNKITVRLSHFSTYIVTNEPIEGAVVVEQGATVTAPVVETNKANPETGASDFVGAAVALAVVSAAGMAALNFKK